MLDCLNRFKIATPSWAYSEGGTRFAIFLDKYAAKTLTDKIEYASQVNQHTGIAPELSIHIPWDMVDDFDTTREFADTVGIKINAINPNLFQNDAYKYGSVTNSDPKIRETALELLYECIEIGKTLKAEYQSYWFADGTNFPGQADFIKRKHWMIECLKEVYNKIENYMSILLEYKFYEPAFYHTDIPDWGTAMMICNKLGEKAKILVDLGHHPQGTNIEFLVANLIDEGKLGGFHLNSRKYGDDDLTTGSMNPYELFLIFNELIKGNAADYKKTSYMLDQSHYLKPKIEAMIQSVVSAQELFTKALLINRNKLKEAQISHDLIKAEECVKEAFYTDVSPLLLYFREINEIPLNPLQSYLNSGHRKKLRDTII
ncbi:MAG: sugar isomerase [Candidatus Lokiarchaeota archaeon]|nr:sugar isomerase [Candidatus Lokiarchaeota archaeon]MBD3341972.1 sugar isomerase [Candidatus Lokiarchaeota archaeon]